MKRKLTLSVDEERIKDLKKRAITADMTLSEFLTGKGGTFEDHTYYTFLGEIVQKIKNISHEDRLDFENAVTVIYKHYLGEVE